MPILVKGDYIRSGTKANAHHGGLQAAQAAMGLIVHYCILKTLQEGCSIPQTFIFFHFWPFFFVISRLSQNDCSLPLSHLAAVWLEAVTVKDHYNLKNLITEPMVRTGNELVQKIWNSLLFIVWELSRVWLYAE